MESDAVPTDIPVAPTARATTRDCRWRAMAAGAALVLLTIVAYGPAYRAGFIWDDDWYVENNLALREPGGLRDIWFGMRLEPVHKGEIPQYYPLVHTTFWLEYRLWGLNPAGYHVVNVLLHATSAVLLWRLLCRLGVPGAWVAAAVFALHPVHVESVAWVTERKNVLSGVFYLAAAIAYFKWEGLGEGRGGDDDRPRRARWGWYLGALFLFLCALFAKTVTSSLPAAILLVIYWKRGRIGWADVRPLVPFFAIGIPLGLFTSALERVRVGAQGAEWDFSIAQRLLIAGRAVWFYLGKLLVPYPLVFIYERWDVRADLAWQWAFPVAAGAVVVALFLMRHRIGRGPLVAALFFGGTLVPALGFVDLLPMRYSFVADHFQYHASLGLIVAGVALAATLLRRAPRAATAGLAAVILTTFGLLTWRQARVYENSDTLWRHVLRHNPRTWMATLNHGVWLLDRGRLDEAERRFHETLAVAPRDIDAMTNLALITRLRGDLDGALAQYRAAAAAHPDDPTAAYKLGVALRDKGLIDEAAREFRRAIDLDADFNEARVELGVILQAQGRPDLAATEFSRVLQRSPKNDRAATNLANALLNLGRGAEARRVLEEVLGRNPDHAIARNTLGIIAAAAGDLPAAVGHFRRAIQARPDFAEAHNNLGKALALQGDLAAAVEAYERALHARPDFEPAQRNLDAARAKLRAGSD